ncbi:multidrug efflux pump [Desulfosalsimonas propionicica]|uniref:Multidrug efflux pump n=1 Tax=Desulfosalsimonas propionicica TaxID=332175 RepID=A0A7W0CB65_9BACT|nr:efflux RND transporter permease subunit [Desulfosalsimonas propionicica]MBA2882432.1 multidrug efflux pump [Desulfosalsimonas propionicica]
MLSRFFINRPIFAWVIALAIMGAGALSIFILPVEQYPTIAAPKIVVSANYPGASAETLENTVTQVIEQNLTGIDNLRYIQATSSSAGRASITLTFEPGTDPDIAQVQTQNKVSQAQASLPSIVQQQGISVRKSGSSYALIVGFYAEDGTLDRNDISDFIASNLVEPLSRVDGVGEINAFGPEHAMRVWLDPSAMYNYKITALDVIGAIQEQNVQLATGEIGGAPSVEGQQINATITAQSLLETPEEFARILLTVAPDGSRVTLGDVARIEIGAESYSIIGRYKRNPAAGIAIQLAPGANALETIQALKDRVEEFRPIFPKGIATAYPVDISPFIRASITEVLKTLGLAIGMVVLVIFIFLQTVRATFIPAVAIPVVLLGTFACLSALGYSINLLTLFALVLTIGMLVDDAIVVTENVQRKLEEDKTLTSRQAAFLSMREISGALVGTTTVLWAVFLPMSFFQGATGAIYRQFSITMAAAMAISLFIALSLSPSLCAMVLRPGRSRKRTGPFGLFNRGYEKVQNGHARVLHKLMKSRIVLPLVFIVLAAASAVLFFRIPTSFLPDEDQGRMFVMLDGPPSATLERTLEKIKKIEDFYLDKVGGAVDGIFAAAGFSFAGRGQNVGAAFIALKDWEQRGEENSVFRIQQKARQQLSGVRDAFIIPIVPPPVSALGNASGFEFQLVDRAGLGNEALSDAMNQVLGKANSSPLLTQVRYNGLSDTPQYNLRIDALKARVMGVPISTVNQTLSTALGGTYVNDFLEKGRVKRVYVQADAPYRMMPDDIGRWYVRNESGGMVPLAEFGSGGWTHGSPQLTRFNGSSSLEIQGSAAGGVSSGQALEEVAELAKSLPQGIGIEWTGLSYEERQAGSQAPLLYAISVVAVFLALAALYESWAIPLAIILIVPFGIFGALLSTWLSSQANDVYFQVGLLMTIGLAAKNAILIVEFAKNNFEDGMSAYDAAFHAAKQRLRPILMTSFTFILGVMPLAFASGPGSGAQNAISIGVLGGISAATLFVVFYAPFFFVSVYRLFRVKQSAGSRNGTTAEQR